ncbi:MAG: molybdenum cofactor cytidylyltransferase [Deltaproteobacteria bacterium]|nr:MAG: molybdenum cofactor cytidylyltransferase [Deltaproteobacteria bacterium]
MNPPQKKIAGVILAAGSSSRMGKTKQLMPFGKTTLLGQVVEAAKESALHEIIIVLGYKAEQICQTLDPANTKIILNKDYSNGQSTSLIKGLENVSSVCDAAMFLLGDQPLVTAAIINRLMNAFEAANALITIPYCNDQRGNPVIIARPLFHRLKSLSADIGARDLFDEFKESILKVQITDKAILIDVDTMDDYKNLITTPDHQQGAGCKATRSDE